jgi:hypothetical protein
MREEERQKRLQEESIAPPVGTKTSGKKPPPPPASRKQKPDQHEAEVKKVDHDMAEKALREQQQVEEAERKRME